jgi:hypothetical protein
MSDQTSELVGQTVTVDGWRGIAFYVDEIDTAADEDTVWTGIEEPTGMLRAHMVGDDRTFVVDPDDCSVIEEGEWCAECGQMGCTADGR